MEESKPFRTLIHAAWQSTAGDRTRFFSFIFLYICAYSIELLIPFPIGYIIGILAKEGFSDASDDKIIFWLGVFVALRLINTLCHHFGRFLQHNVAFNARMNTMGEIFGSLLAYPLRWHIRHHSGESLSKLHRATGAIDQTIGTYVWQVVEGLVKTSFAIVAIFALDTMVAVTVLAIALITILIMILFNKKLVSKIRQNNKFYDRLNRTCVDYLTNIVTVKTLNLEHSAEQYFKSHRPDGARLQRKIAKYMELKWGSTGIGYAIMMGASLLLYFQNHRGLNTPMDVAQVYVLMNYLDKIFQAIGSFTGYYGGLIEASTSFEDAERILKESNLERLKALPPPLPEWRQLKIQNLEFQYETSESSGLKGLAFTIQKGDKIALVGPSGGGKSTFLKLLGGLLAPKASLLENEGSIEIHLDSISKATLLLPQEPEIFSESLRFNLTLDGNFTDAEIEKVIRICRLEKVVAKLPKKLETDLAEKGLNLSVGEKQRVAMARGLLRIGEKQIVLLDEPTSSLDPKTEKEIYIDILGSYKDKTIINACHRLSMVPLFNKVIYVKDGRVEEAGTFEEMIEKRGAFFAAWEDYQKKVSADEIL